MKDNPYAPLFELGKVVATPAALEVAGDQAQEFIARHVRGSWEECPEEDRKSNHLAVLYGARVVSAHTTESHQTLWIITEADRSSTTLLLPDEY
jgi:hypothetical protein